MKLDRLSVITRIDEILAESKSIHDAKHRADLTKWESRRDEWRITQAPRILEELRRVTKLVAKGEYPQSPLVYRNSYGGALEKFWGSVGDRPEPTEHVPNQKLVRLRTLLQNVTSDDTVTTATLRELGFTPALLINGS